MTTQEYKSFETCVKNLKYIAVVNYKIHPREFVSAKLLVEFAAILRDLTIPVKVLQETTDWQRVNSLDSLQYYDRIERIIDKYSTDKIDEELRFNLKQLYNVVMRPVIRQEMISKILGEND